MDAHKAVDEMVNKKEYEEARDNLIKLATQDIHRFILNCQARGFQIGLKTGFFVGVLFSLIIYLIVK